MSADNYTQRDARKAATTTPRRTVHNDVRHVAEPACQPPQQHAGGHKQERRGRVGQLFAANLVAHLAPKNKREE